MIVKEPAQYPNLSCLALIDREQRMHSHVEQDPSSIRIRSRRNAVNSTLVSRWEECDNRRVEKHRRSFGWVSLFLLSSIDMSQSYLCPLKENMWSESFTPSRHALSLCYAPQSKIQSMTLFASWSWTPSCCTLKTRTFSWDSAVVLRQTE